MEKSTLRARAIAIAKTEDANAHRLFYVSVTAAFALAALLAILVKLG